MIIFKNLCIFLGTNLLFEANKSFGKELNVTKYDKINYGTRGASGLCTKYLLCLLFFLM